MSSASFLASSGFFGKGRWPGCCRASRSWDSSVSQAMAELSQARQVHFLLGHLGSKPSLWLSRTSRACPTEILPMRDSYRDATKLLHDRTFTQRQHLTRTLNPAIMNTCGAKRRGARKSKLPHALHKSRSRLVACSLLLHLPRNFRVFEHCSVARVFGQAHVPHRCLWQSHPLYPR